MFCGNQYLFKYSFFNKIITPILFFKQEQLELNKNFFINEIGSFIFNNGNEYTSLNNFYMNESNFSKITTSSDKHLFSITECLFDRVIDSEESSPFIFIGSNDVTFYMTICTFNNCKFEPSIIELKSRANTISHICCNNLFYSDNKDVEGFFLKATPTANSFIIIYYSSIVGTDQSNNPKSIVKIDSSVSIKFQCMNLSNIKTMNTENCHVFHMVNPSCLNLMMSTFQSLTSYRVIWINPQRKGFKYYIGMCNFYSNTCTDSLIYFDMNEVQACIGNCIFKSNSHSYTINANYNKKSFVSIENCVFDSTKNINIENHTCINCTFSKQDIKTHTLAHYIVENVCLGVKNDDAYGCKNESCPDNVGCDPDAFKFQPEDVSYTEMFHPDVDTPTPSPTIAFTESSKFSYSSSFSDSIDFTESSKFTRSKPFSETSGFTKTNMFSKTDYFTTSNAFSKSSMFSESDNFTYSMYFTYSSFFSETGEFTKTGYFSQTTNFTISNDFTKSMMFSESDNFTNSMQFTFSSYFSETGKFTKTTEFTQTGHFSMTTNFTESNDFTLSASFEPTEDFDRTHKFTPSSKFSQSTDFTKSDFFSSSKDFTKSSDFEPSKAFTHSTKFTSSSVFTQSRDFHPTKTFPPSKEFSRSSYFTKTDEFTHTGGFSQSGYFSESAFFTKSGDFTQSNVFTSSKTYNPKAPVVIDIKSDESNGVTIGTKIGIGVAAGAVVTALIVVGIILLRKRKAMYEQFDDEGIEIRPLTESSVISQNPLMSLMSDDDPFEDEFI